MKLSKLICVIMALTLVLSSFQIFAFAADNHDSAHCAHCAEEVDIVIHGDVSPEVRAKIKAHFAGAGSEPSGSKGILCTLFGHKLETGLTTSVTHKVRATSPRCLEETYRYEICSRCDYSVYTLTNSRYIVCC